MARNQMPPMPPKKGSPKPPPKGKARSCPHCGKPLDAKGYCRSCKRQY